MYASGALVCGCVGGWHGCVHVQYLFNVSAVILHLSHIDALISVYRDSISLIG